MAVPLQCHEADVLSSTSDTPLLVGAFLFVACPG